MKKLNDKKWKKIYSCILAVCLIGSLVLANQSLGVFAEKTEEEVSTEQGEQQEKEVVENTEGKKEETVKNQDNTEFSTEAKSVADKIKEESSTQIKTLATDEETSTQTDSISKLIDADETLLKWKADKEGEVTVTVNNTDYRISDDSTYETAYAAVYSALKNSAQTMTGNLSEYTISGDTIWNIQGTVVMNQNIQIRSTDRLVILGDGKLTRNGNYTISSSGTVCLQGEVVADGGGENYDARFFKSSKGSNRAKLYLSDDFKIQNYVICNNDGAGILATETDFYMSGGTVGSEEITFTWDDNKKTEYGEETETYLAVRENKGEYPYLRKIESTKGCKLRGTEQRTSKGAGMAIEQSTFYMSSGKIVGNTILGEATTDKTKLMYGAGIRFNACTVNITGGKISGNQSTIKEGISDSQYNQYSGAIQIDNNTRAFCEYKFSNVEISYNYTQRWVGAMDIVPNNKVYLQKNTVVKYNNSESNSGAIAVDGTGAFMVMEDGVKVTRNHAGGLGGGIRCLGELTMDGGEISYNSSVNNAAGLSVQTDDNRTGAANLNGGKIFGNYSKQNGGGMGIVTANTQLKSSLKLNGTDVYDNKADKNGGGFYVDAQHGEVETVLQSGQIRNNNAKKDGGGIYVLQINECNATVCLKDSVEIDSNSAENGGGIYLNHSDNSVGSISAEITNGEINGNTASKNGAGMYINSGNLTISGGVFSNNIASQNGAGAYVADGKIRMFGGNISNNKATQNGGGMYVSSIKQPADVVIRSGKLTGNKAGTSDSTSGEGNGGAIAVISNSDSANEDHVIIGLRHKHKDLDVTTRKFDKFTYDDDMDESKSHDHESCPEITANESYGNGGGIYMNSSNSIIDIYCLIEENNTAAQDKNGGSIMSEGGKVNIGDIGDNGKGNNTADAVGNVFIKSPMLVKGGDVNLYGNTENPKFADKILVDIIKQDAGSFHDWRFTQMTGDINYKIEYFENFNESGIFTSMQYTAEQDITAMGNMYTHEGYKIVGWNTQKDGKGDMYTTGELIASKNDHKAWDGKGSTEALRLYAIWKKISYTVIYDPTVNEYTGRMSPETFQYGETQPLTKNAYKVTGKRFDKWNREKDGSGKDYEDGYNKSDITSKDGDTITLYAQWKDCTHKEADGAKLSYKSDNTAHTITETCDCEGHRSTVKIEGADVYYDGKEHPATLHYTGDEFLSEKPQITYTYNENAANNYGDMPTGTTKPTKAGYYKATITAGGATTFVEYRIKSSAEAAEINVAATPGQYFKNFNADNSCTVAQEDAFTVQYDVQGLNVGTNAGSNKVYRTAPVLTLSRSLPSGTKIIMQTETSYWYNNNPTGTQIDLDSFTKMGTTSEQYSYNITDIKDAQRYRFIIDFSDVNEADYLIGTLDIGLKYAYTNPTTGALETTNDKEEKATITISNKYVFTAVASTGKNTCTITAPSPTTNTKWERKNLVWKIAPKDDTANKLPSDAKLTVSTTVDNEVKTAIYSLNANGEFIIPFSWTNQQDVTFALNTQQESTGAESYELKAALCVGSKKDGTTQPTAIEDNKEKASAEIALTVPVDTVPSLKISGTDRVLTSSEKLKVDIDYLNLNTNDYTIQAIIQKKSGDEYKGEYYKETINQTGNHEFALQSTEGAGSYRLFVTVSTTNGQTVMEVPYYFIVQ